VTSQMRVEQRAELVVYPTEETDDFDPDALTALLGITPIKLYRRMRFSRPLPELGCSLDIGTYVIAPE